MKTKKEKIKMIEDNDFNSLPEYLRYFVIGALEVLSLNKDMEFHQKVRQSFFNRGKEFGNDTFKAYLTINKLDIEGMGI